MLRQMVNKAWLKNFHARLQRITTGWWWFLMISSIIPLDYVLLNQRTAENSILQEFRDWRQILSFFACLCHILFNDCTKFNGFSLLPTKPVDKIFLLSIIDFHLPRKLRQRCLFDYLMMELKEGMTETDKDEEKERKNGTEWKGVKSTRWFREG